MAIGPGPGYPASLTTEPTNSFQSRGHQGRRGPLRTPQLPQPDLDPRLQAHVRRRDRRLLTSEPRLEPRSSNLPRPSPPSLGYAKFHGTISTELPPNRPDIKRTGYAAFRTRDRPPTIFGRSLYNIDPYVYLALRVKSDGRSYFINVQTESVVPTDLHQHRLFVKNPGQWETVLVKWNDFVRTNYGFVVEPQTEIMRQKVKSIGIGLTDRIPGPFELCIERMWATNSEKEADSVLELPSSSSSSSGTKEAGDVATPKEGKLKTKQGQKIGWGDK